MNTARTDRSKSATLPIQEADLGKKTIELDLALTFDPVTRAYHRTGKP